MFLSPGRLGGGCSRTRALMGREATSASKLDGSFIGVGGLPPSTSPFPSNRGWTWQGNSSLGQQDALRGDPVVSTTIYLHVQLFNVQFIPNKYWCIYCTQPASRDSLWLWQNSDEQADTGTVFKGLTRMHGVINKQISNR